MPLVNGSSQPWPLRVGLVLAWITAAGLGAYAVFVIEQAATQHADSAAGAAIVVGSVVFWALGVALAARGLRRRRRWARSPLVMTYLLLLAVGWALVHGTGPGVPIGAGVLVLAVAGLVVTLMPSISYQ